MVIVVFRSRMRATFDGVRLAALGERMYALASAMPGFLSYKDFSAGDGESVTIVEFESHETLLAWRHHPEHVDTQRLGREEFFSDYTIHVCEPSRSYGFDLERGRWERATAQE